MLRPAKLFASFHRLRHYVHGRITDLLQPQRTSLLLRHGWGDARRRHRRIDQQHRTYRQQQQPSHHPYHHSSASLSVLESIPIFQRAIRRHLPMVSKAFATPTVIPHLTFSFARHVAGLSAAQRPLTTTSKVAADCFQHSTGGNTSLFSRVLQPLGHEAATGRRIQHQQSEQHESVLSLCNNKIFANRSTKGMAEIVYPSPPGIVTPRRLSEQCNATSRKNPIPSMVYLSIPLHNHSEGFATTSDIQTLDSSLIQSVASMGEHYETYLNKVIQLLRHLYSQDDTFCARWMEQSELRVYFPSDVSTQASARARLCTMGIDPLSPQFIIKKEHLSAIGPNYFRDIHQFLDTVDDMIENGPAFKSIQC